nr:ribonuclease H-like domain-containing protein [Tanacetum cinerariifolium]
MLVIKIFSERKKVFREGKKGEKIRANGSDFSARGAPVFICRKSQRSPGGDLGGPKLAQTVEGSLTPHIPGHVTSDEKIQKKNDVKDRSMLLMALPNEHLMIFNQCKDAKSLFDAITTRFGINDATRKTLLKQMNENFSAQSTDTVFGVSTTSPQVSSANLSDATVYAFLANQPNGSQLVHEDLKQIHEDDIEEIDLKWQLALLSMRAKRFFQKTECQRTRRTEPGIKEPQEGHLMWKTRLLKQLWQLMELVLIGATWLMMKLPQTWPLWLFQTQRGLALVEEQLCHYKKNESLLNENIDVLKSDILIKDSEIAVFKSKLEKISKEKDDIEESEGEDEVESPPQIERKSVEPSVDKVEVDIPKQNDKPARRPVKYAEMYRTQRPGGNQRNWNNLKSHQFWCTASAYSLDNEETELNAIVDGQDKTITEASVMRHLKLADADGISTLPITKIFKQLALIGTRRMGIRIPQSNVPSSVADEAITKEMHDGLGRATTTASSLEAEQGSGKATLSRQSSPRTRSEGGLGCHVTIGVVLFRLGLKCYLTCPMNHHSEKVTHLEVGEGSMQLLELMDICTKLSDKVTSLENELKSTKAVYNKAFITLAKRVKKLEKKLKHKRRRTIVDSSEDKEAREAHETAGHRMESDDTEVVDFNTASPQTDNDEITLVETLVNIKKSAAKAKGKAIMQESEPPKKIKKKEMIQISLDEEITQRFYEEEQAQLLMDEEYAQQVQAQWVSDEARISQENLAQAEQWDDVQAQIQADEDLAQRMLEEERESLSIEERSRLLTEFIDQRKKMLAAKKAEEKRNKPHTQAQQRTYISNYIKNIGGYRLKQLKQYSFEEIKMLLDRTMESIIKFVSMESEGQIVDSKAGEGSSKECKSLKRPTEEELGHKQQKKQKVKEYLSQERLQQMMVIVPKQGIHVEALQTKEDLVKLWSLVKERFSSSNPTEDKEIALCVELKRLFELDKDDELWKFKSFKLIWRLCDWCAFGGVGDDEVVVGKGVVVTSSSLEMLANSCLRWIMVSLIFLKGLEEEALEEFMVELFKEDDKMSKKYGLFN